MEQQKNSWVLAPIGGTLIFVALYIVATVLYPGGSQVDAHSIGFSWVDNYWCNLLNEQAMNGRPNPAKPIAMAGLFVLCLSLVFFWFQFPRQMNIGTLAKLTIQYSGVICMAITCFLFTNINHDLVINLASCFGLIAMAGTFIGLYKMNWHILFIFGLLNILLMVLNASIYYNKELILYLPITQKICFATFLTWICCISFNLYNRKPNNRYY